MSVWISWVVSDLYQLLLPEACSPNLTYLICHKGSKSSKEFLSELRALAYLWLMREFRVKGSPVLKGIVNWYSLNAIMNKEVQSYNNAQATEDKKICDLLAKEISAALPEAENKIWHAIPVWFLEGNPVVGYGKLKNCIRLLFWSGQTFDEPGLTNEGKFKAAEARYTNVDQVNIKDLSNWLAKARDIQWDYKNIVKRRGVLERLK
jgi:hypothetical protein